MRVSGLSLRVLSFYLRVLDSLYESRQQVQGSRPSGFQAHSRLAQVTITSCARVASVGRCDRVCVGE